MATPIQLFAFTPHWRLRCSANHGPIARSETQKHLSLGVSLSILRSWWWLGSSPKNDVRLFWIKGLDVRLFWIKGLSWLSQTVCTGTWVALKRLEWKGWL